MVDKKQGTRGKRPPTAPALRLRRVLAENVHALMERDYPLTKYKTKSDAEKAVGKDAGLSFSSIQRVLDPSNGTTLDTLADLAVAFGLRPSQLLIPDIARVTAASSASAEDKRQDAARHKTADQL